MKSIALLLTIHAPADFDAAEMVAVAQRVYRPTHVTLSIDRTVPSELREIGSVRERNLLAGDAPRDGTLHVFVVDRIADKEQAGIFIGGVHWYHRGRRYLIVSRLDGRHDTLAHEVGHYLGLRHTRAKENLMTTPDRLHDARLTAAQVRRLSIPK